MLHFFNGEIGASLRPCGTVGLVFWTNWRHHLDLDISRSGTLDDGRSIAAIHAVRETADGPSGDLHRRGGAPLDSIAGRR